MVLFFFFEKNSQILYYRRVLRTQVTPVIFLQLLYIYFQKTKTEKDRTQGHQLRKQIQGIQTTRRDRLQMNQYDTI